MFGTVSRLQGWTPLNRVINHASLAKQLLRCLRQYERLRLCTCSTCNPENLRLHTVLQIDRSFTGGGYVVKFIMMAHLNRLTASAPCFKSPRYRTINT